MKTIDQIVDECFDSLPGNLDQNEDRAKVLIRAAIEEALANEPDGMMSGGVRKDTHRATRTFVVDWNWTNQQCGEELMKFLKDSADLEETEKKLRA